MRIRRARQRRGCGGVSRAPGRSLSPRFIFSGRWVAAGVSVSRRGPWPRNAPGGSWQWACGAWGCYALSAGVLGWLLARPRPRDRAGRIVRALGWCACAVLLVRGISVEVLLLTDTAGQDMDVSPEQRLWTLLLWNPWFLVGGLVFGMAAWRSGRAGAQVAAPPDGASGRARSVSEIVL
ncbi:DUF3995 domain-containing protein [Streptomyces atratus]|nr:DUF3995 domain-containing protein [Streptomyces atratus]